MTTNSLLTQPLFKKTLGLGFQSNTYAIFGSGPIFARNLTDEIHDVDIIVTDIGWQKALMLGQLDYTKNGDPVVRIDDNIEIFNNWVPGKWNIQNLIHQAETIDGLPFVKLEKVLAWKNLRNKPKDQKHIKLIERYLKK